MVAQHFGAPYVPTHSLFIQTILDELDLKQGSVLYDLGSGDGRLLRTAAKKHPNISAIGIESRKGFVLLSRFLSYLEGTSPRITFRQGNLLHEHISDATHMYLFLTPYMMEKIEPHLVAELSHTRVISLGFPLPKKPPSKTVELPRVKQSHYRTLYIYDFSTKETTE
jgi:hypothetical protein